MTKKIFIGNLSLTTTESRIYESFSKVGKVISFELKKAIDGKTSAGYGYMIMDSDKNTEKVIAEMNDSLLDGKRIRVMQAHRLDQEREYTYRYYKRY